MTGIQSKITRHLKKPKNIAHTEVKKSINQTQNGPENSYYNCIPYVQKVKSLKNITSGQKVSLVNAFKHLKKK
jgi:hypothetical protein